jgi:large subunit ribosomal protein L22
MGARKKLRADAIKEANKTKYFARLNNCPTSPQKMRLVADLIRGVDVLKAMNILKFSNKEAAVRVHKLLSSAIHNYESKTGLRPEDGNLFVSEIFVDGGMHLKRLRTAPQGRAYRVRKRSNHVTLVLDSASNTNTNE